MKHLFLFFIALLFLFSCREVADVKSDIQKWDTFYKDIPKPTGNMTQLYAAAIWTRDFLGELDTLEYGYDSLQIRLWYEADGERKVVVIKKNKQWIAQGYYYEINPKNQDSIYLEKLEMKRVFPKIGFTKFVDSLVALDVLTLPDERSIPDLKISSTMGTINVEVATKNRYRFYSYTDPTTLTDRFSEARKMVKILQLIRDELGINTILLDR